MRLPLVVAAESRAIDVVALGEISLDLLASVAAGDRTAGKRQLQDFRLEPGGQMATAALGCARLGLRARFVGVVGDDEWSERALAPLEAARVEVVATIAPGCPGRIAVVLVDASGDRTILERRDPRLVLPAGAINRSTVAEGRILLVDATQPAAALRAIAFAREAGTIAICDVDHPSAEVDAILAAVDVAVVPGPFALAWAGTGHLEVALERLAVHCRHAALIVATRGADGSLARCRQTVIETPAVSLDVVDTTGAGDAFRAGLAAALVHLGPEADAGDVLRFANATGALNCRSLGAQTGLPTLDEVERHVTNGRSGLSK